MLGASDPCAADAGRGGDCRQNQGCTRAKCPPLPLVRPGGVPARPGHGQGGRPRLGRSSGRSTGAGCDRPLPLPGATARLTRPLLVAVRHCVLPDRIPGLALTSRVAWGRSRNSHRPQVRTCTCAGDAIHTRVPAPPAQASSDRYTHGVVVDLVATGWRGLGLCAGFTLFLLMDTPLGQASRAPGLPGPRLGRLSRDPHLPVCPPLTPPWFLGAHPACPLTPADPSHDSPTPCHGSGRVPPHTPLFACRGAGNRFSWVLHLCLRLLLLRRHLHLHRPL